MNEKEKKEYLDKYKLQKEKGVPFFPDIVLKDAIAALAVFLVLVALAYFLGAKLEARANPADTSYTPRPEWYFLFLFQLLKYFPGNLEVIGVVFVPMVGILLLVLLPWLDRSSSRHFVKRPVVVGGTLLVFLGIIGLTVLSILESPPPSEAAAGDQVAALYSKNCSSCHGASILVPPGTNLHEVIAQGRHQGMPAWSADLTSDEIDALAGFILSPTGSKLFTQYCGACHETPDKIVGDAVKLSDVLAQGPAFPSHAGLDVPDYTKLLKEDERSALLNFLVAPDGQRLFAINCSPCHGQSVATTKDEGELMSIISKGGMHLEMPAWQEKLSQTDVDTLANYVMNPAGTPAGKKLYETYCFSCHGDRIPQSASLDKASQAIKSGGSHNTMPVWGNILTKEQLDALVSYTLQASKGLPQVLGQQLFAKNCAACHGSFGEGGPNPGRAGFSITAISSTEYLKTRDDTTLRAIISQGQPDLGMSPFGSASGGPLSDDEIDALVAFIRSWETNPPAVQPPEASTSPVTTPEPAITPTVGTVTSNPAITPTVGAAASNPPLFTSGVLPIFNTYCVMCHGMAGEWDASSYDSVMNSGENAPVIIPGDPDNSLLAQKILGTQSDDSPMPPMGKMADQDIQLILDWIKAGALNN